MNWPFIGLTTDEATLLPPPSGLAVNTYCARSRGAGEGRTLVAPTAGWPPGYNRAVQLRCHPNPVYTMTCCCCLLLLLLLRSRRRLLLPMAESSCPGITSQPQLTRLKVVLGGATADAAPLSALVASAVSRVGAPGAGMARGRLLEAGTSLPLMRAVAVTVYSAPDSRPVKRTSVAVLFLLAQRAGAAVRHMLTIYSDTTWLSVGGLRCTRAVVVPIASAAAIVGAPSLGVRMVSALAPGTALPAAVKPTTWMVSAGRFGGMAGEGRAVTQCVENAC